MGVMEWDEYYLRICDAVASNSKCLSRKIGAILVKDKSIIAQGYNGPPRGVSHCGDRYTLDAELQNALAKKGIDYNDPELRSSCPRYVLGFKSGEGLMYCCAGHAERNTLINAARNGICTKDTIMYMSCPVPCSPCLIEIINAGVSEIVVTSKDYYDLTTAYILSESGLKVRTYHQAVMDKNTVK